VTSFGLEGDAGLARLGTLVHFLDVGGIPVPGSTRARGDRFWRAITSNLTAGLPRGVRAEPDAVRSRVTSWIRLVAPLSVSRAFLMRKRTKVVRRW
jgi:hypothetical protein